MKNELITRALLGITGLWFLYRFIAPLLTHYIFEKLHSKKDNKNVKLDILIARQESIMRKGLGKKSINTTSSNEKSSKNCILKYSDAFQNGDLSAKKVLTLFDQLQWGDGDDLQKIQSILQKQANLNWNTSAITKKIKSIFEKEYPILGSSALMTIDQIHQLCVLHIFITELERESYQGKVDGRGKLLQALGSRMILTPKMLAIGFDAWEQESSGVTRNQVLRTICKNPNVKKSENKFPRFEKKITHQFIDSEFFGQSNGAVKYTLMHLQLYAEIVSCIIEINQKISPSNFSGACELLGVSKKIDKERLKKVYKRLAKLYHPDTLNARQIPAQFEQIAANNFVQIKKAYEIILNEIS